MSVSQRKSGQADVVCFTGDLTDEEGEPLFTAISDLIVQGASQILIDLSEVNHMSSSGVGLLVRLLVELKEAGAEMKLLTPSDRARQVLDLVHISQIIPVVEDEAQAF